MTYEVGNVETIKKGFSLGLIYIGLGYLNHLPKVCSNIKLGSSWIGLTRPSCIPMFHRMYVGGINSEQGYSCSELHRKYKDK